MFDKLLRRAVALGLATIAGPVFAGVIALSGKLDDSANTALVASDLGPALFSDDWDTANNVALYGLNVPVGGSVNFTSTGFAAGGIDPYVTLFSGTDRASATFRESNYLNATTVGGDFTLDVVLAAGQYTVAIGVFENMSFAENLGSGFLADGFIGLGGPSFFGDGSYTLAITLPETPPVPEPGTALMGLTGLCALAWASRRRRAIPKDLTLSSTTHGGH